MNKKPVDLQSYNRRDHFNYFKNSAYPYVGITAHMDITKFMDDLKSTGNPFYLSFVYHVVTAANSVAEFRRRIENGGIVEYEYCRASCVVLKDDETFAYTRLNCDKPFEEYLLHGKANIERAKNSGSIEEDEEAASLFFISCIPWVSFTSLTEAVPYPANSNPRFSWGKYFKQDGKVLIPVSVFAHHALVDGLHISRFYQKLERILSGAQ